MTTMRFKIFRSLLFATATLASASLVSCGGGGQESPTIGLRLGSTSGDLLNTTPPSVSDTSPPNGDSGIALNSSVSVTFSKVMTRATLNTTSFLIVPQPGGAPIAGAVSASGNTATFTPSSDLAPNTQYRATITTAAKDAAGNALATNFTWDFSSGASFDTTPPTVSATSPANAATGIATNSSVSATFSEAMTNSTLSAANFLLESTADGVPLIGTANVSGNTLTFVPSAPLIASTQYTAGISANVTDAAGNPLGSNYTWHFTTGANADTTPPTVTAISPVDGATGVAINSSLSATFSKAMTNSTLSNATFTLARTAGGSVDGTVRVSGNTVQFTPIANLYGSTGYRATITTAAKDAAGNALASNFSWNFITAAIPDSTPPTVVANSPTNGANGVALNASVSVTFSKLMANSTLNTASFTLVQNSGGVPFAGTVSVDGMTATFASLTNLAPNAQYTATVSTAAKDAAGNPLAANFSWTFTSAGATPVTVAALAWDAVTTPNLSGYRVYYGTSPGTYLQSFGQGISVGSVPSYTLNGLNSRTRYYFAVTAFDAAGNESGYSNEVLKDIP